MLLTETRRDNRYNCYATRTPEVFTRDVLGYASINVAWLITTICPRSVILSYSVILLIYHFKKVYFLSENGIFGSLEILRD